MTIWKPDISGRGGPKYLRILEAMVEDITEGRLPPGTRMPPHRDLAYQLNISPNTISRAYAEATRRALLKGEVGRGTFVRATDHSLADAGPETLHRPDRGPVDLSRNLPMPGLAETHVRRAMSSIVNDPDLCSLMDYQTDVDLHRHRLAGKAWISACGLEVNVEQIIPVVGGQHGIFSVMMALLQSGDLILTEALTYTPVRAMAQRLGLQTGAVAMDENGIVPEALDTWCRKANPKALYITPTLQTPTTVTLCIERRIEIANIAKRFGLIIIEDDVFGPLKQEKPAPIASLAPETTVYVTSLSKAVAPGLRVGFLAAPQPFAGALHQSINLSLWMTPPVTLEITRKLIKDGTATQLTRRQQQIASHRQDLAQLLLGRDQIPEKSDGFHIWIPLPKGWRADAFVTECRRKGTYVSEGRSFAMNAKDAPEAIRICISHEPDETRLYRGLETVAAVLKQKPSEGSMII